MLKQCLVTLGVIIILIAVYFPARHARHYKYIEVENVFNSLQLGTRKYMGSNIGCSYQNIIINNEDIAINSITKYKNFSKPLAGKNRFKLLFLNELITGKTKMLKYGIFYIKFN